VEANNFENSFDRQGFVNLIPEINVNLNPLEEMQQQ